MEETLSEQKKASLLQSCSIINQSMLFLALLIVADFISLGIMRRQKGVVCNLLAGQTPSVSSLLPARMLSAAIGLGGTGYFLDLALRTRKETASENPGVLRALDLEALAALLVVLASILRIVVLSSGDITVSDVEE